MFAPTFFKPDRKIELALWNLANETLGFLQSIPSLQRPYESRSESSQQIITICTCASPPLASCNDTPRSFGSTARPFISSHVVVFVEIVYPPSNVFLAPFPPPTLVRGTLFLFGIRRLRGGCCLAGVGVGLRALGRH